MYQRAAGLWDCFSRDILFVAYQQKVEGMRIFTDKASLRSHMRRLREQQPLLLAKARAVEAQERILDTRLWQNASTVALYSALKGEMGTERLLQRAFREGKAVFLPRVRPESKGIMDFARIISTRDLVPSAFGILEPRCDLPGLSADEFKPELVVMPGLAFDVRGCRLGFGGGFYDRFFSGTPSCPLVGLCFAFQVAQSIPSDPWDVRVSHLCTEEALTSLD